MIVEPVIAYSATLGEDVPLWEVDGLLYMPRKQITGKRLRGAEWSPRFKSWISTVRVLKSYPNTFLPETEQWTPHDHYRSVSDFDTQNDFATYSTTDYDTDPHQGHSFAALVRPHLFEGISMRR